MAFFDLREVSSRNQGRRLILSLTYPDKLVEIAQFLVTFPALFMFAFDEQTLDPIFENQVYNTTEKPWDAKKIVRARLDILNVTKNSFADCKPKPSPEEVEISFLKASEELLKL